MSRKGTQGESTEPRHDEMLSPSGEGGSRHKKGRKKHSRKAKHRMAKGRA